MNKKTALCLLAGSAIGLAPAAIPAQEGEDEGFSFSADDFTLAAEAPPPAPVYDNFVEAGVGYSDNDSSPFTPYSGLDSDGAFVTGGFGYYKRGPWDGEDLSFLEAEGDRLGLRTRSLRGEGGVQGKYRLLLGYDELPFDRFRTRTPYRGAGSAALRLPPDWRSNPTERFNTATQNLPDLPSSLQTVDIKTERTRYGGGVEWNIDRRWTARVSGRREEKDGLKPLGIAWGTTGQNPAAVIVPAPVDYRTDTLDAEVAYRTGKLQFRLGYQLSLFENEADTLTLDNPFTYSGWNPAARHPTGVAQAQLAPDNKAHSFNLAGGYDISDVTRVTANLVYSRYEQDDAFLPYTSNPLLGVQQGLPRSSLDGEIDNTVANLELFTRPAQAVEVRVRYRYTDRDNDTPRDQYVYVRGDAEDQQIGGTQVNYRTNTPYGYREHLVGGDVGYRFQTGTKVTVGYDYRNLDRTFEAREENTEHTGRIDLRHRFTDTLSGSADYARTWRDGSAYDNTRVLQDSYTEAYVESLEDAPFVNHPLTRAYYLADMVGDKASLRLTYVPTTALTLGVRGSYKHNDFDDTQVGLTDVEGWGLGLDAGFALSEDLSLTGFYTYDARTSDQAGWAFEGDANQLAQANDPTRRWFVENDDRAHTLGLGLSWQIRKGLRLSADYSYTDAVTETSTRSGGAFPAGDFPDLDTRIHRLQSDLDYDLTEQWTLGLTYLYEGVSGSDWQTDEVAPDTIGRVLSLPQLDPDYDNHLILAWTRFKF
jgi:MtrB/PioB family decaheme-associated outer membrane protein